MDSNKIMTEIKMRKLKPVELLAFEIKEKIGDKVFQNAFGKSAEELVNEIVERSKITFEDELEEELKKVLDKGGYDYFERDVRAAIGDVNYRWEQKDLAFKLLKLDDDIFVVIVSYKDNEDGKTKIFAKALDTDTKEIWGEL